jgi:hypothetical protein
MTNNNRIGDACFYQPAYGDPFRCGRLLAWSTDHVECEHGYGNFPVGVIEDTETGEVHSVYAERITFKLPEVPE